MKSAVGAVKARRVWDSRGRPTLEVEVALADGSRGRAMAPAGASRGSGEAVDLRDDDGFDVRLAVDRVNTLIAPALQGLDATQQAAADRCLIELDGTTDRRHLGGNALVASSMAIAHAAAVHHGVALWRYLAENREPRLPLPEIQIFGGGAHAGRRVDIQDFMVIAVGAGDYPQALDWTARVYHAAGRLLSDDGRLRGVADEGGYWPDFDSNVQALEYLTRAIEAAGLVPGEQVAVSLDVAASEFGQQGRYRLARDQRELDSDGLCEMLGDWLDRHPIVSIEDPLAEDDEAGLIRFTEAFGERVQIVGDDCLVTNAERVKLAQQAGFCNALLVKPNQAGTLTEARAAFDAAAAGGWANIVSARSGETEDTTIVHLAVGWGAPQLKVGSFARSERMAKWNEGLRITEQLDTGGSLAPVPFIKGTV